VASASSATESFGPNVIRVVFLIVVALLGYAFGQDLDPNRASIAPWAVKVVKTTIVAVPITLLCWLLSVRLSLDPVGIRYRSLLGQAEMRWDEVDELYVGAVTTLLNGIIPAGTRYRFRLKSGTAREQRVKQVRHFATVEFTRTSVKSGTAASQLSFGSRFSNAMRVADVINNFTFPVLWQKMTAQYNNGLEVSFGDFRVSRQGVRFDLLGMFPDLVKKPIPWADVRSYSVENGSFTLMYTSGSTGKTYKAKRDVADIANFQVMLALLQDVKPQSAQVQSAN
jgi:hypothetical protein